MLAIALLLDIRNNLETIMLYFKYPLMQREPDIYLMKAAYIMESSAVTM